MMGLPAGGPAPPAARLQYMSTPHPGDLEAVTFSGTPRPIYPLIQHHAHIPTSQLYPMPLGAAHYPNPQGQNMMIPILQQHQQF